MISKKEDWRIRASIPVPPACEAGALPFELIPQLQWADPFDKFKKQVLQENPL